MEPDAVAREFAELAEALHTAPTATRTAEQVVDYARQQLEADYAGITLIRRRGRLKSVAPSHQIVSDADALQYELNEGSCLDSSWSGEVLVSQNLSIDPRWPRWAPKAAALGIGAVLAAELTRADGRRRIGSVNLYWRETKTFTADDVAYCDLFSRHAAVSLSASLELAGLNVALDARKRIGQAQGILMERHGLDEDRAFEVMKRYSQDHKIKLRQLADYIVSTRKLPGAPAGEAPAGSAEPPAW